MKKLGLLCLLITVVVLYSCKKDISDVITESLVQKHISILADDSMQGRKAGTEGAEKAAQYIEGEFKRIGLQFYDGADSYRQAFAYKDLELFNVIGYLPGKSKKDEFVIVSAHYDHLGIATEGEGDLIFNGANDNASGTTAMLALAEYWKEKGTNDRSVLFIGFTAEEMGLIGSIYFGKTVDPDKIMAGINIEMIGKESTYGPKTAWVTGYDRSDFAEIIQKNVEDSGFKIYQDPYFPDFNLFFRSDNAALAMLGVPAHSFSTSPADDKDYHQLSDEVKTLDLGIVTETIQIIALATNSLIEGTDTPTRIQLSEEEEEWLHKMLDKVSK